MNLKMGIMSKQKDFLQEHKIIPLEINVSNLQLNCSHGKKKLELVLGGTARNPEDVEVLHNLRLKFAEIPISNIIKFKKNINEFLKVKEKTGLYYLCHGPREGNPNNINSLKKHYFPQVLETLEIMPILSMSLLTLHLWMDRRFVKTTVLDFKIELLRKIINKAREKRILICLENLSENWHDLEVTFDQLPLLHLTLDVGHGQLLREENTSFDFIKRYPDRIKHIHLHDNLGGRTPEDDLHLPPGRGIVNFKNIFNSLTNIGYRGTATLELKPFEIKSCLGFVKKLLRA
jgi:sugar phosphate isomerase/epimerase